MEILKDVCLKDQEKAGNVSLFKRSMKEEKGTLDQKTKKYV